MGTRRKATRKKSARGKGARRKAVARKRLTPRAERRGLSGREVLLPLEAAEVADLARDVEAAGGAAIGAYREPFSGRPLLLASLPIEAVSPTPFQRDLSPAHTKRLAAKIEETGSFLDPLVVVRGEGGALWTPNGRHRLAAAKLLGLRQVTGLVSPDAELAFRILALNTEKAHNLKDRSLEVIRMARELARRRPTARETEFAAEFEEPSLLVLGIVYEQTPRFAGGAYAPFLRRLDRFRDETLRTSLRKRADLAARLLAIEAQVAKVVGQLRARGFRSPYLRNLVVARINPVRFQRRRRGETEPPMPLAEALTRMAAAARRFNTASVRESDLALLAAASGGEE